ncbi:MAG: hypothetical protein ACM3X0_07005 [Bacteroidota bacterium]
MHKALRLIFAVSLAVPFLVSAAEVAKIEIYADGVRQHELSFQGPNSSFKVSSTAVPNTTLELRLIAPEPLIVEVKESINGGESSEALGKVKLLTRGDSLAVS